MPSDRIERNHNCNIDLVACIDVTSGMAGQLDALGTYLLSLRERVERRMTECSCTIGLWQLRVRVIAFRDYGVDEAPMLASRFFVLNGANGPQPAEREALRAFLDTIGAQGGGDEPENALEALALAMQSDWTRAGAEVVQIYVGQKSPVTFKPEKELRAFKKIRLAAGEEQEIEFTLNRDAFSHYDPEKGTVVERGNYFVMAAASSRDIRAKACVRVDGDEGRDFRECASAYYGLSDKAAIPREQFYAMSGLKQPEQRSVLPVTLHSPLKDMANSKGGKLLYRLMLYFAGKGKDPDTAKMQRAVFAEMPVVGLTVGIPISREGAQGFAEIANGHRLRGIKIVLRDLKKYRKKKGKSPV